MKGYAYDGGRRWRKDYGNNQWTWYPCGVACSAGELVEQQSDLTGNTWTTTAQYLKGAGCSASVIRRNSEFHHFDLLGTAGVITNASGTSISDNLYDVIGRKRAEQGSAETPHRVQATPQQTKPNYNDEEKRCKDKLKSCQSQKVGYVYLECGDGTIECFCCAPNTSYELCIGKRFHQRVSCAGFSGGGGSRDCLTKCLPLVFSGDIDAALFCLLLCLMGL